MATDGQQGSQPWHAWQRTDPRVLVLGPFRVARLGTERPARTRQVGRVGAVLAATPGTPVPRDRLISTLWGAEPPNTAVNSLQVHISQLRSTVGRDLVDTHGDSYVLAVEPAVVDAEWFKSEVLECLDHAHNGQPESIRDRLAFALSTWVGEPYSDVASSEIAARRSELIELRDRALELKLSLSLRVASSPSTLAEVIAAAKGHITRQPVREVGYEVLIGALIADGRPAEAAAAYGSALEFFQSTLGVEPSERLRRALSGQL